MNLNRYSPHYDHDGQCVRMEIDANGAWVHITAHREAMRREAAAEQKIANLRAANTKLVGALDMIHEGLKGSNVQDLALIVNTALAINRKAMT